MATVGVRGLGLRSSQQLQPSHGSDGRSYLLLCDLVWNGFRPFSQLRQLLDRVGFVDQFPTDGLELLARLRDKHTQTHNTCGTG